MTNTVDDLQVWISAEYARRAAAANESTERIDARVTWAEVVRRAADMGITLTEDELRTALVAAMRERVAARDRQT